MRKRERERVKCVCLCKINDSEEACLEFLRRWNGCDGKHATSLKYCRYIVVRYFTYTFSIFVCLFFVLLWHIFYSFVSSLSNVAFNQSNYYNLIIVVFFVVVLVVSNKNRNEIAINLNGKLMTTTLRQLYTIFVVVDIVKCFSDVFGL